MPTWCSCRPTSAAGSPDRRCATTLDALAADDRDRLFAVVATAGTTNAGVVDDLAGAAEAADSDSARGCTSTAPTAAPGWPRRACATCYDGIEHADSFIVDPHKWLFAPFDSCALVYRDPEIARAAHTQHAEYLDVLHGADDQRTHEWNPADYAHHLSRRARGLPFWFSLATHGTDGLRRGGRDDARRHPCRGRPRSPTPRRTSNW